MAWLLTLFTFRTALTSWMWCGLGKKKTLSQFGWNKGNHIKLCFTLGQYEFHFIAVVYCLRSKLRQNVCLVHYIFQVLTIQFTHTDTHFYPQHHYALKESSLEKHEMRVSLQRYVMLNLSLSLCSVCVNVNYYNVPQSLFTILPWTVQFHWTPVWG